MTDQPASPIPPGTPGTPGTPETPGTPGSEMGIAPTEDRTAFRHTASADAQRAFLAPVAQLLHDLHCEDIIILDLRGLCDICDCIVIATGTSDRQIKSIASSITELAGEHGFERFGQDVDGDATWLVLDYVDVIVHLFEPNARAHYDLEGLWYQAPKIPWQRK